MKDPDEAERMGRDIYGQPGGHLLTLRGTAGTDVLDERITRMRGNYESRVAGLRVELAARGLKLELTPDPAGKAADTAVISAGAEYDFEDVKGLDLHHMRYDFSSDVEVGARARDQFVQWARSRRYHRDRAMAYLKASGQKEAIANMPVADIDAMNALADQLGQDTKAVLPSEVAAISREREVPRRSRTVQLGTDLVKRVESQVDRSAVYAAPEAESVMPIEPRHAGEQSRINPGLD
jgi:hypothetical protein